MKDFYLGGEDKMVRNNNRVEFRGVRKWVCKGFGERGCEGRKVVFF